MFDMTENPIPTTCRPFIHRELRNDDGTSAWTWACGCADGDRLAGLHYERLDAAEEAYEHKAGEF